MDDAQTHIGTQDATKAAELQARRLDTYRNRGAKLVAYTRARGAGNTIVASARIACVSEATAARWERRDKKADRGATDANGVPRSKADILAGISDIALTGETASARLNAYESLGKHLGFTNAAGAEARTIPASVSAWLDAQESEAGCSRCKSLDNAPHSAAPEADASSQHTAALGVQADATR